MHVMFSVTRVTKARQRVYSAQYAERPPRSVRGGLRVRIVRGCQLVKMKYFQAARVVVFRVSPELVVEVPLMYEDRKRSL